MLRLIGIVALALSLLALATYLQLFPVVPHSTGGWLAFFFLGIPCYVVAEISGESFWSRKRFAEWPSAVRIVAGVVIVIVVCAVFYLPWKTIVELIQS